MLAAVGAIVIVMVVIGVDLFRDLTDQRVALTREQRAREDAAIEHARALEKRNFEVDIVASVFDPLGLFH